MEKSVFWGDVMKERQKILCPDCGGNKFKIVKKEVVSDVTNKTGEWKQGYIDLTIEEEDLWEVVCANCGKKLLEKHVEKPISKKAWEEFWASYLSDYIMGFEHYAVNRELTEEDHYEAFLEGMAKGMWTIYNLIESMMVQDQLMKGRKKQYYLTEVGEVVAKCRR